MRVRTHGPYGDKPTGFILNSPPIYIIHWLEKIALNLKKLPSSVDDDHKYSISYDVHYVRKSMCRNNGIRLSLYVSELRENQECRWDAIQPSGWIHYEAYEISPGRTDLTYEYDIDIRNIVSVLKDSIVQILPQINDQIRFGNDGDREKVRGKAPDQVGENKKGQKQGSSATLFEPLNTIREERTGEQPISNPELNLKLPRRAGDRLRWQRIWDECKRDFQYQGNASYAFDQYIKRCNNLRRNPIVKDYATFSKIMNVGNLGLLNYPLEN